MDPGQPTSDRFEIDRDPSRERAIGGVLFAAAAVGALIVASSAAGPRFFDLPSWVGVLLGSSCFLLFGWISLRTWSRAGSKVPKLVVDTKGIEVDSRRIEWSDVRAVSYRRMSRNLLLGIDLIEHSAYVKSGLGARLSVGFAEATGWPSISFAERWLGGPLAEVAEAIERFGNIRVTDAPLTGVKQRSRRWWAK